MRKIARMLGIFLCLVALLLAGLWLFGPYEDATLTPTPAAANVGEDVDAHFAQAEAAYDDITPGVEKRVDWIGEWGSKTEWSILYVHGFSATSEEIRPVPDLLAAELGANLVYTRLTGHGRGSDAMADGSVQAWVDDLAEGLAAARQVGNRVLIMSTSTGATLTAAVSGDAELMQDVGGLIFVSPNFGVRNPLAKLLTWPAARYWLPLVAGDRRSFTPHNDAHGKYWTTEYPSVAVMPMGALIKAAAQQDYGTRDLPALFWFSKDDGVVDAGITAQVASDWGGPVEVVNPVMGPNDDPLSHVIAGEIMSPDQTQPTVAGMADWARGLDQP
ncbi:alpha/beta hydrolase [uncultured Tateyamaria sp.]|uniref:alpha/beta hydrolase n=1 Tax=uncultured Tateyamaria sp. TaxID=455651 RepID=UPI00261FB8A7|nr:alpha/beta hydrolase [uncultured Tateyamaria sp.]